MLELLQALTTIPVLLALPATPAAAPLLLVAILVLSPGPTLP